MERTTLGKKNSNGRRLRLDRFVAPRDSFPELRRRMSSPASFIAQSLDVLNQEKLSQKNYVNYLNDAFDLGPLPMEEMTSEHSMPRWPCFPRKRRFLSTADSILDLPNYRFSEFPELLDWSHNNVLVAALGKKYHKWSWSTQSSFSHGLTNNSIQCCKYDGKGEMLLLGTDMQMVEMHNSETNKMVTGGSCRCFGNEACSITALDWSPTGNSFVTGCSKGMLISFDRNAHQISSHRVAKTAFLMVRISPDARYVAASTVNSESALILVWPTLVLMSSLHSDWILKAITWHPWRSSMLAIGAMTHGAQCRLALWDAPTTKARETCLSCYCVLDTMVFSSTTGELVVSLWDNDPSVSSSNSTSHLLVFSDPRTVVDKRQGGKEVFDRIRTMIFNPDGTKLATASFGEDLIIWNFLPEDKHTKKKNQKKRFYKLPVYLDEAKNGRSFR